MTLHADDSQLYLDCRRDDMALYALRLERCLSEVGHWMSSNRLKLNVEKKLSCSVLDLVLYWVTAAFLYNSE